MRKGLQLPIQSSACPWRAVLLGAAGRGIHSSLGWVRWPRKESGLGNNSVYLREGEEVPVEDKILDRTVRETLLRK